MIAIGIHLIVLSILIASALFFPFQINGCRLFMFDFNVLKWSQAVGTGPLINGPQLEEYKRV